MNEKIKLGKYKHYSGKYYKVIGWGRHSENLEEYVIYQGLYNSQEFGNNPIWLRPLKMFKENIEKNNKIISRFTFIE